jgi:hypothetical protein
VLIVDVDIVVVLVSLSVEIVVKVLVLGMVKVEYKNVLAVGKVVFFVVDGDVAVMVVLETWKIVTVELLLELVGTEAGYNIVVVVIVVVLVCLAVVVVINSLVVGAVLIVLDILVAIIYVGELLDLTVVDDVVTNIVLGLLDEE